VLFCPAYISDPTGHCTPHSASSSPLKITCGSPRYCLSQDGLQRRNEDEPGSGLALYRPCDEGVSDRCSRNFRKDCR